MGKRYFCDYCDRTFVDDPEARKKHLNGTMHLRMRKEHYDKFRDAKAILAEESTKLPCKRYLNYGECVFGTNCRYSHYSPEDFTILREQITEQQRYFKRAKVAGNKEIDARHIIATWLKKLGKNKLEEKRPDVSSMWQYPVELQHRDDIPQSLKILSIDSFLEANFSCWG